MKKITCIMFSLLICIGLTLPTFASDNKWVEDQTGVLSQSTVEYIENLNENVFTEYKNKPQLAVVIIDKLPCNMDTYKNNLFNEFGVGTSIENCGLLFVFAIQDHEYGLEIGDGYNDKSSLKNALETDFISDEIKTFLTNEDYDTATLLVVKHLEQIMANEEKGIYAQADKEAQERLDGLMESMTSILKAFEVLVRGLIIIFLTGAACYFIFNVARYKLAIKRVKRFLLDNSSILQRIGLTPEEAYKRLKEDIDKNTTEQDIYEYLCDLYKEDVKNEMAAAYCASKEKSENYVDYLDACYRKLNKYITPATITNDNIPTIPTICEEAFAELAEEKRKAAELAQIISDYVELHPKRVFDNNLTINEVTLKTAHELKIMNPSNPALEVNIKAAFEKAVKELTFNKAFDAFLLEHVSEIDLKYFDKNKFRREAMNSPEYNNCSSNNWIWLYPLLLSHLSANRSEYNRTHSNSSSHSSSNSYGSSFNSSFGSGFGGGSSSGGGFHGSW